MPRNIQIHEDCPYLALAGQPGEWVEDDKGTVCSLCSERPVATEKPAVKRAAVKAKE